MHSLSRTPVVAALAFTALALVAGAAPAAASFHFMQIEQVVGGVCGNSDQQAIQLRMRFAGQELVTGRQLKAWDALGANPIVLITFPFDVDNADQGSRILAATAGLASAFGVAADFILSQLIPDSYLQAGRLTFEDGFGTIYWSLAWGGGAYLGSNLGDLTNDADGNFGPPFGGLLPFSTARSLRFPGGETEPSVTNLADYALSAGAATLVNNDDTSTLLPSCLFGDGFVTGNLAAWSAATP